MKLERALSTRGGKLTSKRPGRRLHDPDLADFNIAVWLCERFEDGAPSEHHEFAVAPFFHSRFCVAHFTPLLLRRDLSRTTACAVNCYAGTSPVFYLELFTELFTVPRL